MKRKEAIKVIGAISMLSFLPKIINEIYQRKTVHFIGIGGAGKKTVEFIEKQGVAAKFSCINEIPSFNSKINFVQFLPPGERHYQNGVEIFRDTDMNMRLHIPEDVKGLFSKDHTYILIAGLGGYTGTFMIDELSNWLKSQNRDFHIVCSIPFKFENRRRKLALETQNKLKSHSNFHVFDNENINEKHGNLSIVKAFELSSENFYRLSAETGVIL